jgi:hypothetical protein
MNNTEFKEKPTPNNLHASYQALHPNVIQLRALPSLCVAQRGSISGLAKSG